MGEIYYYRDQKLPIFEVKTCEAGVHACKDHAHEELSMGLVLQGSSMVQGAGRIYPVGSGTLVLIPPGVVHHCHPERIDDWRFKMLYLNWDWVTAEFGISADGIRVKKLSSFQYQSVLQLFDALESGCGGLAKEQMLIAGLTRLLAEDNGVCLKWRLPSFDQENRAVDLAKIYLDRHFLEPVSLERLAVKAGLSKYYLVRHFKAKYQVTPHAYQMMRRVNYAKKCLKAAGADSIIAIAHATGFFDQSHFVKIFRQYIGTTPQHYRLGVKSG